MSARARAMLLALVLAGCATDPSRELLSGADNALKMRSARSPLLCQTFTAPNIQLRAADAKGC